MSVTMSYAGVPFAEVRAARYGYEPVYDSAGINIVWQKLTIQVVALLHTNWLADSKASPTPVDDPNAPTAVGVPGNRMGISLERLRHTLMQKGKRLCFRVGLDLVVDSPPPLPDARRPVWDCDYGPRPLAFEVMQFVGDASAIVSFSIETCLSDCDKTVVSNVWTMGHSIDEHGYTTRTTTGEALCRADFLTLALTMNADSFRAAFFVPATVPFQRENLDRRLSEDGKTLYYTLTDVTTQYSITTAGVTRVEGNCTAGGELPFASEAEVVKFGLGYLGKLFGGDLAGGWGAVVEKATPSGRANFLIRVYGVRSARKRDLYQVALNVAADRFAKAFADGLAATKFPWASLYVTTPVDSHSSNWVEIRGALFMPNFAFAAVLDPLNFAIDFIKMEDEYASPLNWGQFRPTPVLGGDGAAGSVKSVLAHQPPLAPCALPRDPKQLVDVYQLAPAQV